MPYNRPDLKNIDERIFSDLTSRVKTPAAILSRSVERVLARAIAGSVHLLYGYLDWLAKQRFVHSMEDEFLDKEGATYNLPRKNASFSTGQVVMAGRIGKKIEKDTKLKDREGNEYLVCEDVNLLTEKVLVKVKSHNLGQGANLLPNEELLLTSPLEGIDTKAIVSEFGITGGANIEDDESYRERILDRKRQPPHGGNSNDYKQWALQVQGVTRAWVFPQHMGVGTVGLMFTRDNNVDFIPTEEQCQEVYNYIEKLRPVTAEVFVFAPQIRKVDFALSLSPDTEQNRIAVIEELKDFLLRDGVPSTKLRVSRMSEAISQATGEHHHQLISPVHDVLIQSNEIPVLGQVEFIESKLHG